MWPAAVKDPHLGEGDIYYGDGGPDEVFGVDGAFSVMVEVPAEDRQGSFFRACVVGEYGVVRGRGEKLQVVPQALVHVGGHARLVDYLSYSCARVHIENPFSSYCTQKSNCFQCVHSLQFIMARTKQRQQQEDEELQEYGWSSNTGSHAQITGKLM